MRRSVDSAQYTSIRYADRHDAGISASLTPTTTSMTVSLMGGSAGWSDSCYDRLLSAYALICGPGPLAFIYRVRPAGRAVTE